MTKKTKIGLRIRFVTDENPTLGSYRMRVERPKKLLTALGHHVTVDKEPDTHAHWNIFMKHFKDDRMLAEALAGQSKTCFDICDDHFQRNPDNPFTDPTAQYYTDMCNLCDIVTVNSEGNQRIVKERTGVNAKLIKDPINFPWYSPRKLNLLEPDLLWFGHSSNLDPIIKIHHTLKDPLTIICNGTVDGLDATSLMWREGFVEEKIKEYDIVVLPIDTSKPHILNKSTNRVVDAIRAGRFVVTNSHEVYGELEPFCFIGDIAEGIQWAKDHPDHARMAVLAGQEYIKKHYGDKTLGECWEDTLTKAFYEEGHDIYQGTLIQVEKGKNN